MTSTTARAPHDGGHDARLLGAQLELLVGVVSGHRLSQALDSLLRVVEEVSEDGMLASVLLLDDDGQHLRHCAAPSLPPAYSAAIDGIQIGPAVGSCGTAAYLRRQVIAKDIAQDPRWLPFQGLARTAGLQACWSTPIIGNDDALLGTFAMYYPDPNTPSDADLALIEVLVRTVGLAIERRRRDERMEAELAERRAQGR